MNRYKKMLNEFMEEPSTKDIETFVESYQEHKIFEKDGRYHFKNGSKTFSSSDLNKIKSKIDEICGEVITEEYGDIEVTQIDPANYEFSSPWNNGTICLTNCGDGTDSVTIYAGNESLSGSAPNGFYSDINKIKELIYVNLCPEIIDNGQY